MLKLNKDDFKFQLTEEQKSRLVTEDAEVTAEQKDTVCTLFESAVNKSISAHVDKANETISEMVETKVEEVTTGLKAKMKEYLAYVVNEWKEENEDALKATIQAKLDAQCVANMKKAFTESNVTVPEEQKDLLVDLQEEVERAESKSDQLFDENVELKNKLFDLEKEKVLQALTSEMTDTQKEDVTLTLEHVNAKDIEEFQTKAKLVVKAKVGTTDESSETPADPTVVEEDAPSGKDTNSNKGAGGNKSKGPTFLQMAGL